MRNTDDTDKIVSLLYDGVTSSGDWYDALDGITHAYGATGFHNFALNKNDPSAADAGTTSMEMAADVGLAYATHYAAHDLRLHLALQQPLGQIFADQDHFDARAVSRSQIYTEFLIPHQSRYTIALRVREDAGASEFVAFLSAKAFTGADRQWLAQLAPHVQRAAGLRARMHQLAQHAAIGLSALEHVLQGIAVVDGQGRVLHMNPMAEAFAAADGPCRVVQGRLQFVAAEEQARFAALAAAACAQGAAPRKADVRVPAAGAFRVEGAVPALVVSVIPLKASHPLAAFRQVNLALVVLAGTGGVGAAGAAGDASTSVLRELWGLTATEARLALALTAGRSIKEFAEAEGSSWHTARAHLRSILRKSGCRRQLDVVQVVQSLVPGVG